MQALGDPNAWKLTSERQVLAFETLVLNCVWPLSAHQGKWNAILGQVKGNW